MSKKCIVITTSKELYDKLNMLSFTDIVVLENVKRVQVDKILKNINKRERVIDLEELGARLLLKKIGEINFNVYLKR